MKTLALVMIVKNEEKGLEKAILSCKDFVNEIVIAVDESSTDRTMEIAKKYATTLKTFKWRDDFAWARNFAQEGVKSDWLFFLDGHEYVKKCERLNDALSLDADGLLVKIEMETGSEFSNPRFYKNGIKFVGKVHERQECTNAKLFSTFVIKHDRINGQSESSSEERAKQRDDQMVRIMGGQVKNDKKDLRALFHLCLYYFSKSDWKNYLKYSSMFLKASNEPEQRWFVLFHRSMTFIAKNRLFRAFWVACRAEAELPYRWENEKLKGLIFFQRGKYEKALQPLVNSFNRNKKDHFYKPWERDDAGTWNLIGESFFNLGIYEKASIAFGLASEEVKDETKKKFFKERSELMKDMSKPPKH